MTVHFSASDTLPGSYVDHTEYDVDDTGWQTGDSVTVLAPIDHANDGVHTVSYYSIDTAGNREATTDSCQVKIDTVAPQVSGVVPADGASYAADSSATLTWSALDPGDAQHASGLEVQEAWIDDNADQAIITPGTTTIASLGLSPGDHTLTLVICDAAGNETDVSNVFTVLGAGSQAPVTSDDAPDDWQNAAVTVHLIVDEVDPAGLAYTAYSVAGPADNQPLTKVPAGTAAQVTIPAAADHANDGIHTITYYSVDANGNAESPETCQVKIDTTPPQVTGVLPADGASYVMGTGQTVAWSASDPGTPGLTCSGLDPAAGGEVAATIDDEPVAVGDTLDDAGQGAHTFALIAADAAGNESFVDDAFTNVNETLAVSRPAAGAQWRLGSAQAVRYTVQYPLTSGEFGIILSQGGQSTLLGTQAAVGQSSYLYPWTVAGPAGTAAIEVGWRPIGSSTWTVLSAPASFTVLPAQTLTVTAPGASAVWPRKSTQSVTWTVQPALAKGQQFTVTLRNAAGRTVLTKTVNAKTGVTAYTTKLRVSAAVKVGTYTVVVASGALSPATSAPFQIVPARALHVSAPALHVIWSRGHDHSVSWTLYSKLTDGTFNLYLVSAGGRSTLLGSFSPTSPDWQGWTGSYQTTIAKAALKGIRTGANYRLIVRWSDGVAKLSGRSGAITITK